MQFRAVAEPGLGVGGDVVEQHQAREVEGLLVWHVLCTVVRVLPGGRHRTQWVEAMTGSPSGWLPGRSTISGLGVEQSAVLDHEPLVEVAEGREIGFGGPQRGAGLVELTLEFGDGSVRGHASGKDAGGG
jgi:hypothetical protein